MVCSTITGMQPTHHSFGKERKSAGNSTAPLARLARSKAHTMSDNHLKATLSVDGSFYHET